MLLLFWLVSEDRIVFDNKDQNLPHVRRVAPLAVLLSRFCFDLI